MLKYLKNKLNSILFALLTISIAICPSKVYSMETDKVPTYFESIFGFRPWFINKVYKATNRLAAGILEVAFPENLDEADDILSKHGYGGELIGAVSKDSNDDKTFVGEQLKPVLDKIDNIINSKSEYLFKNRYKIAGATIVTIIGAAILIKTAQILTEKSLNWVLNKNPKFLVEVRKNNFILSKILNLIGLNSNRAIFLNQENITNVPVYILNNKLIAQTGSDFRNLVLTGPESFVKRQICEATCDNSGQKLIVINGHEALFDQNLSYDQKKILVNKYLNNLKTNGSNLVLVNLDNLSAEQLDKNKDILKDIINYAKNRFGKLEFIFTCKNLDDYKNLLDGCYDQVINIEKPDKNSRKQMVSNLVENILQEKDKTILNKLGLKSELSPEKIKFIKEYFTQDKLDWIVDNLENKTYQEVLTFIAQLKLLLLKNDVKNFDLVIKFLTNKSIDLVDNNFLLDNSDRLLSGI